MPSFNKGGGSRTPFGGNEYLRSTQDVKKTSYTVSAASVAVEVIDGFNQKVLMPGEVMAKITSGPEAGKVGPFDANATDGRQTAANVVGLNDTWLPWQLLEHDEQIAVTYEATATLAWCFQRLDGARIALTTAIADGMRNVRGMDILFK